MPQWFYARNDTQAGPVELPELQGLVASGQVRPEDLVWTEGMANWQPANSVAHLQPPAPAARPGPPPAPPFSPYAAGPPPAPPQAPAAGPYPAQALPYGGYAPPPGPAYGYRPGDEYAAKATTAFVLSLIGLFTCGILSIIGTVMGTSARNGMKASGNTRNEGLAIAAMVLGWIGIGMYALFFVFFIIGIAAGAH